MTYAEYEKLRVDRPDLDLPLLRPTTIHTYPVGLTVEKFIVIRAHQIMEGWLPVSPDTGHMPVALASWLEEHPEYQKAQAFVVAKTLRGEE